MTAGSPSISPCPADYYFNVLTATTTLPESFMPTAHVATDDPYDTHSANRQLINGSTVLPLR